MLVDQVGSGSGFSKWNVCKLLMYSPGANPTIVSYNAGAVKIYNGTSSLVLLENKNILFCLEKRCSLLQRRRW
jgi:hypothetical protein